MRLITLGRLELDGSALTRPTPLLLLAYLRLEGQRSRRVLAELFFGGARDPRDSLSNVVRRIRREAPGALAASADRLDAAPLDCDALELLASAHDDPATAVALHTGPFLDGLALDLGIELEEWLFETREALARDVCGAHLRLATTADALGDADRARRHRERAAALADATGIEAPTEPWNPTERPPAATTADLPATPRMALPPLRTRFVGRDRELDELLRRLRDPATRILTLYGIGGIGKSRLAAQLARRAGAAALPEFRDGVAFVPLDAVESASGLAQAVARACGVAESQSQRLGDLGVTLADRHLLLVLDNFEQLLPHATDVADLVDECPHLTVVVTSRERLHLSGETSYSVEGLATQSSGDAPSDAERLFEERAGRARRRHLAPHERSEAQRICTLVGGHPLAIELAAGMTRALPVAAIADELDGSLEPLHDGPQDAPARHRSVRNALESSWTRLSASERELLARLAVFEGSFSREAATAVAAAGLSTLLRLSDRALVTLSERGRYHLHPLSRAFTRERVDDDDDLVREVAQTTEAHQAFFATLLRNSAAHIADEPADALARIDDDLANVLSAIEHALTAEPGAGVEMLRDLVVRCNYLSARGRNDQLMALLETGIDVAEKRGEIEDAHFLTMRLANTYRELDGDPAGAEPLYHRALDQAEQLGDPGRQAIVHGALVLTGSRIGHPAEEIEDRVRRAFALADQSDDPLALCRVLQNAGFVAALREDWSRMEQLSLRAVSVAEELHARTTSQHVVQELYFALHNTGVALHCQHRYRDAEPYYRRALDHARRHRNRSWEAFASDELGDLHHDLGERTRAQRWFQAARDLYRSLGARHELRYLEERMRSHDYTTDLGADPAVGTPPFTVDGVES